MSQFNKLSEVVLKEGRDVVDAALKAGGETTYRSYDIAEFPQEVALAALVMTKGTAMETKHLGGLDATDYLREDGPGRPYMERAAALVLDRQRSRSFISEEHGDASKHMVNDIINQIEADAMHRAITDPSIERHLTDSQRGTVEYAKEDPDVVVDIKAISEGRYQELGSYIQGDVSSYLANHSLSPEMRDVHLKGAELLYKRSEMLQERASDMNSELGDFVDFGTPLFKPVEAGSMQKVDDLIQRGQSTGDRTADAAIMAHADLHVSKGMESPIKLNGIDTDDPQALTARARLVQDVANGRSFGNADDAVKRIEADRVAMHTGSNRVATQNTIGDNIQSRGEYELLSEEKQKGIYNDLETGDKVSPVVGLRMGLAAMQNEREGRERMQAMYRDMALGAGASI